MKTFDAGKPKKPKHSPGRRFLIRALKVIAGPDTPTDPPAPEDPAQNLPTTWFDEAGNHRNERGGYNLIIKSN